MTTIGEGGTREEKERMWKEEATEESREWRMDTTRGRKGGENEKRERIAGRYIDRKGTRNGNGERKRKGKREREIRSSLVGSPQGSTTMMKE